MLFPTHLRRGRRTAATVSGALLALALLAGCGDDEPTEADDPASTPAAETSDANEPTTAPTSESSAAEDTDVPEETVSVEVFFAGDTPQGARLYAEQHAVDAADPLEAAVALLTSGGTKDPDYRSLLQDAPIESVSFDGVGDDGVLAVGLSDDGWSTPPAGMSKAEARLAIQQLVYSLQEAARAHARVDFYLGDQETTFLGQSSGVTAAEELDVRATVNILTPVEEETVRGSFTAEGMASSFEATVPWEVRDASGAVVLDGFTTAEGWIERLYPWTAEVDVSELEPGSYTFVAMTDDPSGGEGGGPTEDTKTIVVD